MRITKLLATILTLCLTFTLFAACGSEPNYEPLEMKKTEIITPRNNSWDIAGIIDFRASGLSETNDITVKSGDESLAKYENRKIVFGNDYGTTTLEIIVGNKKGTLNIKVVPYIEYLQATANEADASGFTMIDYYAASWLINNLSLFKNPASVSVEDILYTEGSVTSSGFNAKFLIMEIRAQNGFGGYGVDYYKVTSYGIEEVSIASYNGLFKSYNGESLFSTSTYSVNKAVAEYIEENYR